MKRLIVFPLLLFAGAASTTPPPASSAGDTQRANLEAAQARAEAQRAQDEAQRAGDRAARQADDAQRLAEMQKRMDDLAQRMAELSVKMGDQASASALSYLADSKRGMLGVVLDGDSSGLRVSAVTPDGPADRASIRDGDVIVAIDGASTRGDDDMFLARRLTAGKPVTLSVLRDGKTSQVRVTPQRFQTADWQTLAHTAQLAAQRSLEKLNSPEFQKQLEQRMQDAMKQSEKARAEFSAQWGKGFASKAWFVAPWWGLNLASLNPDLGRYFGTQQGALVLSNDAQRYPGLLAGDVITQVNGGAVSKPEDAMRALQSLPIDKPVRLTVLRHGKQLAVQLKTPPRWNVLPPLPPAPPAPPAAPMAAPAPVAPSAPAPAPAPPAPPAPPAHASL